MFIRSRGWLLALLLIGTSVWITTPVVRSVTITNEYGLDKLAVVLDGALMAYHSASDKPFANVEVRKLKVTAYSSSPDETDDTPNITAMGSETRNGVIAANFLPFGAKVRIPKLFGDTVFTVEDRMHQRFQDRLDVWFPTKAEAKRFGLQFTEVEIEI
ncbi:MAG: hypothetical protein UY64_C0032G0007 [Parcubacteria group bacterium GW2011_GWA1_51_12]|nr:MAG: hypothetical protein UY64_C0032G0007 [Parcubacteria group bacterium GW2011_GWA1_51_12]